MKPLRHDAIIGAFVLCASGSFVATNAWRSQTVQPIRADQPANPTQVLGGWLRLMPEQVENIAGVDPTFTTQVAELEASLARERETLARMFEDASAADGELSQQVEAVIDIHNRLERRVAEHLLALRPHLTNDQRSRLFQTCAEGIRKAGGHRWRHGRGGDDASRRDGRGGPPEDRGPGRGGRRGPRWRDGEARTGSQPASNDQGDRP